MKKTLLLLLVVTAFSCKKKSDDPAPSNNGGNSTPSDLTPYTWLVERYANEDSVVFDRDTLFLGSLNQGTYSSSVQWNKAIEGDFTVSFDIKYLKGSSSSTGNFAVSFTDQLIFTSNSSVLQILTAQNGVSSNLFIPYSSSGVMGNLDIYTRNATYGTYTIQRTGSQIYVSVTDMNASNLPVTYQKTYTNMSTKPAYLNLTISESSSTKLQLCVANFNYKNAAGVTTKIPLTKNTAYVRYNNRK